MTSSSTLFQRKAKISAKKAGFHEDIAFHYKVAEIVGHQNFAQNGLTKQELDKINPIIRGIPVGSCN